MLRRRYAALLLLAAHAGACHRDGPTAEIATLCERFALDTVWIVRDSAPAYEVVRRCLPMERRP